MVPGKLTKERTLMDLYKQFKMNEVCEKDGITLDYGDGVEIKIARAGGANKKYTKAIERMARKYRRQIQLSTLAEDVAKKLWINIYAETIVLNWKGVKDENGKKLSFSKDNCVKLFTDLPDLFADIQAQAQNLDLFRNEIREIDAKN
jgi:hypothetical protein